MQCSPFQPGLHSHLPSLQVPCSLQRGWHALWSQTTPVQPSSQRQPPATQMPWPPQSDAQSSVGVNRGGNEKGKGTGKAQGRGGVIENKSRSYCQRSDGHAPLVYLMALEKEFSHLIREERIPFGQYKSNKSVWKGKREVGTLSDFPTAPWTFLCKWASLWRSRKSRNPILTFYGNGNTSAFIKSCFAMIRRLGGSLWRLRWQKTVYRNSRGKQTNKQQKKKPCTAGESVEESRARWGMYNTL